MPDLISTENQEIIARELAACDVSPEDIHWAISKLDAAALRFSRGGEKTRMKKRSPKTLMKQINRVKSLTGAAREKAIQEAVEMGLDQEALELLGNDELAQSLREYEHHRSALDRLNPEHFGPYSNRDFPEARRFIYLCLGVWTTTAGRVRFAVYKDEAIGPLARFLTAAAADAYTARGLKIPSLDALRQRAKRLAGAVAADDFEMLDFFLPIDRSVSADDEIDQLDDYFWFPPKK